MISITRPDGSLLAGTLQQGVETLLPNMLKGNLTPNGAELKPIDRSRELLT